MTDNVDLSVSLSGVLWKNPVTTASGTFASGKEHSEFIDISRLGAVTVKGVSPVPWQGNPPPRVAETFGGMLNAIGLENPGVDAFIRNDLPFLRGYNTNIIVNVCGHSLNEYLTVIERLAQTDADMLELNISCPNISAGGMAFGTDPKLTYETVRACKTKARQPLYVKLSPNVTSITEIARAAEAGGADGLSLINTLLGMRIDIEKRAPILGNKTGGLSGPAILPVALRMVYQVYEAVKIPIIGMGGIMTGADAIEFMLAGASAVAVGTAGLIDPVAPLRVIQGIAEYLTAHGYKNPAEIVGAAH